MILRVRALFVFLLFVFGLIVFTPSFSYADCTNPPSFAGGIAYDSVAGVGGDFQAMLACDGTDWVPWAGWTVTGYPAPQYSSGSLSADSVFESHLKAVNAAADEECLTYETTTGDFEWQACGGGGGALNDLSDAFTDYVTLDNLFMGQNSGSATTPGAGNLALGGNALTSLDGTCGGATDCDANIAIGLDALTANTIGDWNTAIGYKVMDANTTGGKNTAVGKNVLRANTTGGSNIAVGVQTLNANTTGSSNVAFGRQAMEISVLSSNNAAFGDEALRYFNPGAGNAYNVAIGAQALLGVNGSSTGTQNTALGALAGDSVTTGSGNVLIGYDADTPLASTSNHLNIGDTIYGDLSTDTVGIGKVPAAGVELDVLGDINYTGQIIDVSDIRLKENVRPLQSPLKKLTALNGIAFEMKGDPEHATEYGVSAQDVEKVFPELVRQVDNDGTLGVNYSGLIAPLIEAVKEQQAQIEALEAEIESLKAERDNKPGEL